jgi:hypothetical protein
MAKKSLSGIDFQAPILLDGVAGTSGQVLTSQGSSSSPVWSAVTGSSVTTSDTAPTSPGPGDLWYDSDTGFVFVYYDDGTSSQWIEILASAVQELDPLGNLEDISDVNATGVATGNALVFDSATANWVASKDTDVIKMNAQTISANYSIPVGYNGMSAGPITISSGVVVTIPAGSSWSIV